ncbi:MAG: hypothetical protein ACRDLM_04820 [Gaiellaceae bacterium]
MLARHREALVAAAAAASVAALLAWLGPPGTDFAAHAYQRALFLRHGFTLWDNYWYAGRYSFVGYSVLYYPLAALLGIRLLAVLGVALGAGAFAAVVEREWGADARWSSRAFALVWAGFVLTAAFPFALGLSIALCALWTLQTGRRWWFAALVLLTLAASPVALALLVVALAGVAVVRGWRLVPALVLGLAIAIEVALLLLFASGGHYPFPASEAGAALGFCAVCFACTWRVGRARTLAWIFAAYAVAVAAVWIDPATLGENVTRLRYLAFPLALLVLALRRWRPLPVAALLAAAALAWNVTPLASGWDRGTSDATRHASVWRAPLAYLHAHLRPGYRVEAVDTTEHWPSYYLADAGIPIVRGWFRQDDFPTNALLYRRFTAAEYLRWLHSLGVAYVVLSDTPADYSSRREAELVPTVLRKVSGSPQVATYAVPQPRPITRAHVVAFNESSLVVRVAGAGAYRIAVHWSPYWHASTGSLSRTSDGMIELRTTTAATVQITFSFG